MSPPQRRDPTTPRGTLGLLLAVAAAAIVCCVGPTLIVATICRLAGQLVGHRRRRTADRWRSGLVAAPSTRLPPTSSTALIDERERLVAQLSLGRPRLDLPSRWKVKA
ncbi:hypothetical protein [Streptomyces mirabilis]|uniref:hypothetical protein n=1 Tax=Streptomyces mirabilis TaxID=68239 RepID=UPI0036AA63AC